MQTLSMLESLLGERYGVSAASLLMVRQGSVRYAELGGTESFSPGASPITVQTRFNIGSVTKPVTGALLIKLVESGKVALHDQVQKYIPEFLHPGISLLHLLTHTGGYSGDFQLAWPSQGARDKYMKTIYAIDQLAFQPGTANQYFTFGYSILMDVIERVTGRSLEAFAREVLFGPLGMDHTTFDPGVPALLPLHQETLEPELSLAGLDITGDSGLLSTAADLGRFGQMLLDQGVWQGRSIFSEAAVSLMFREVTPGRTPVFWLKTDRDLHHTTNVDVHRCFSDLASPQAVGHNGFSGCMFFLDPAVSAVGVILTNGRRFHADGRNYARFSSRMLSM
ncbi:serine hydrolase domain-containing protein [Paenibacillus gansuensis]|uniref:Serine hydrolase domain-containing protein n=1 Tax=Paenibacillus gansuensis TaxID=306542 RepID=A0ABW5PH34_9BACL